MRCFAEKASVSHLFPMLCLGLDKGVSELGPIINALPKAINNQCTMCNVLLQSQSCCGQAQVCTAEVFTSSVNICHPVRERCWRTRESSLLSPVWCDSIVPSSQQPCVDRECTQLLLTVTSGWQGSVLFILNTVTPTAGSVRLLQHAVQCSDVICIAGRGTRTLGQGSVSNTPILYPCSLSELCTVAD